MEAAAAAGIDRSIHYDWMKKDPSYPARFAEAKARGEQAWDDEATERATKGVFEPLVYQGQFCFAQRQVTLCLLPDGREVREEDLPEPIGDAMVQSRRTIMESFGQPLGIWRKSDGLLQFKLRGAFARYRQNAMELTGAGGGPVQSTLTVEFVKPKA